VSMATFGAGDPRTVIAVLRPFGTGSCFVGGGCVASFGMGMSPLGFDVYLGTEACGGTSGEQYVQNNGNHGDSDPLFAATPVSYLGQSVLAVWEFDGTAVTFKVDGVTIPLDSDSVGADDGDPGFLLMSSNHQSLSEFAGYLGAIVCYALPAAPAGMLDYLSTKYGVG
jgi:hypothetical protein